MSEHNFKTRECEKFCNEIFEKLPASVKSGVQKNHLEKYSEDYRSANYELVKLNERVDYYNETVLRLPTGLKNSIEKKHSINKIINSYEDSKQIEKLNRIIDSTYIDKLPIREHFNDERLKEISNNKVDVIKLLTAGCFTYCEKFETVKSYIENIGIELSDASIKTNRGLVLRALNENWWLRQLRKTTARAIETIALSMGLVCKKESIYCSPFALERFRASKARNKKMMENTILENDSGESFTLQELSEKTTANPAIRRMEFMTRIRGFEEFAEYEGKEAVFLTVTAPSKYHTKSYKYNGATPRETQQYLNGVWARTRAQLARENIEVYGFRVAEPHHDGTPHGHSLLFVEPESKARLVEIFTQYALEEDTTEKGAKENRVKTIYIDSAKGSAVGYIAKYISKNIDGHGLDVDLYGENAESSAERIAAWASIWGIRQFQQIGGVPVTIWRTLRNIETELSCVNMETARTASNAGEWDLFTRNSLTAGIELLKEESEGENQYGEPLPPSIIGVVSRLTGEMGLVVVRVWTLRESQTWTCLNNCTPLENDTGNIKEKPKLRIVDN